MISLVEPYLRPVPADADLENSFVMRKRILSDDQRDALEFLFALQPTARHTTLQMNSSSGKTKVVLFYYEWLKSQDQKVSVISYNKKGKYELYASRLDIRGYSKHDFIAKKVSVKPVDVVILDQSGFSKRTLRYNRDRVNNILSLSDSIRVVEVQSDWNDLLAENAFTRKCIFSDRCKFQLQVRSLAEGTCLSLHTKTTLEVCSELFDTWFTDVNSTENPLVMVTQSIPELQEYCKIRKIEYIHFRDESALCRLESTNKLILICDSSSASSSHGIYSIHSELRYLFHRFVLPFRAGREVSAVVVAPSEKSIDMGFCISLLFSFEEIKEICAGIEAKNPCRIYIGLDEPNELSLRQLLLATYGILYDKEKWSSAPISLDPTSYFECEEGLVRVQRRNSTAPFEESFCISDLYDTAGAIPFLHNYLGEQISATLFCSEDLSW